MIPIRPLALLPIHLQANSSLHVAFLNSAVFEGCQATDCTLSLCKAHYHFYLLRVIRYITPSAGLLNSLDWCVYLNLIYHTPASRWEGRSCYFIRFSVVQVWCRRWLERFAYLASPLLWLLFRPGVGYGVQEKDFSATVTSAVGSGNQELVFTGQPMDADLVRSGKTLDRISPFGLIREDLSLLSRS